MQKCLPGRAPNAFTLLEVIVVGAIIALVMVLVAPRIGVVPRSVRVKTACSELRQVFQQAARRARATGVPVQLVVDPQERQFQITAAAASGDFVSAATLATLGTADTLPTAASSDAAADRAGSIAFPKGVEWDSVDQLDEQTRVEPLVYTFYPNGEADGPALILRITKADSQRLHVDRLTGQLHLLPVD